MIREIKFWKKNKWHRSLNIKLKLNLEFDLLQDVALARSSCEYKMHFSTFTEESIEVHLTQRSLLCLTKFLSRKLSDDAKIFCESLPKCFLEMEQLIFFPYTLISLLLETRHKALPPLGRIGTSNSGLPKPSVICYFIKQLEGRDNQKIEVGCSVLKKKTRMFPSQLAFQSRMTKHFPKQRDYTRKHLSSNVFYQPWFIKPSN